MRSLSGANPMRLVSLEEGKIRTQTHTEGRPRENTGKRPVSECHAEASEGPAPALHLNLGLSVPRSGRNKCLHWRTPVCDSLAA